MSKSNTDAEKEAVLMALDQLSQTMDVMRNVVVRLKHQVEESESGQRSRRKSGKQEKTDAEAAEKPSDKARVVLH